MTQSIFLNRPFLQLLVAGPLFMASTPLWAGVHFSNEQIIPATSMARETPTIAYTFLLTEKLVPFEVEASLRAGLTKTLNTRDALRAALKEDQPSQRIKGLRNAYDELRQAYLPKLFGLPLKGSAAIARSLLEWDEARLIFDEDELYYRQSMRTFRNCRADCVKPEKPFPEYGDILHGLIEGMPPEDEPRMQVYNLYLRGLLLQESGDEVLAVAVYREAIQIGQSRLIPEIHMRLANLAASIGNFSAAAQEYGAVAFGEYYAQSRVGQAWAYGQNRDCENVLKTAARFRHTVSSEADQKRFGREVLQYETDCAANYLRMSQVVEYDPAGVSIIEQEITASKRPVAVPAVAQWLKAIWEFA